MHVHKHKVVSHISWLMMGHVLDYHWDICYAFYATHQIWPKQKAQTRKTGMKRTKTKDINTLVSRERPRY